MKKFFLLAFSIFSVFVFGQNQAISEKVQALNAMKQQFTEYQLFTKSSEFGKSDKYLTSVSDVTILNLNSNELNRILSESPNYISLTVPYLNESIEVQLYKQDILTDDFIAHDESGNVINYTPGNYYRGIVGGDYNSIAAISFFEDDVIGVVSTLDKGNIVVGKSVDKQDYITYSDESLLGQNPFSCGVDEIELNRQVEEQISFDPSIQSAPQADNCVNIYYEIAYSPFMMSGGTVQSALDWITGIQNNIDALYENHNINIAVSQIRVWTYQDPYTGDYGDNLFNFQNTVKDFNGDFAHLINYPSTTSVAFVDALCTDWSYAYSGINMNYEEVPTYSWTIMAMSHEMGHTLGSPHTHTCVWNGDDTPIDGCGPAAGYSDGCDGPIPSDGGTVMSYCHLNSVGINFNHGFGPQPAQLIRDTINSKECLSSDCHPLTDVCSYAIQNLAMDYLSNGSASITITDNSSTSWKYQVVPYGQEPNDEDWTDTTTTTFEIPEMAPHEFYEVYVINICEDGSAGGMKKTILLFGDFCDGTLFTDTGGTSGAYKNNENWKKTFNPSSDDAKVILDFDRIGLSNTDFMYIHNGDSTDSPLFEGGIITGHNNPGPTFQSTDSSGAITIQFISDSYGTLYGWEANVNCESSLGLNDLNDSDGISIYPNPTKDLLNINSNLLLIESIQLTDTSGKSVLNNQMNTLNGQINISHLPKGVYLLTIKTKDQTISKKIIKR